MAAPRPLARLLDDPDASVVEVAAWACGERRARRAGAAPTGWRRWPPGTTIPSSAKPRSPPSARSATRRSLPAVLAATGDKATVRRRAVIALAAFEGPEVDAALEAARGDRDWQVRQAAEDLGP